MTFGERLEKCIKESKYTQKDLAEKIGITPVRLNYWVKDKRQPDVQFIRELANALEVSADYLIGNESSASPTSVPSLSAAALALAQLYDTLDPHSQKIVDTVARMESERPAARPSVSSLPDGITLVGDMPMHRIPYLGEAICDGSIEAKYAAKQELRELQAETENTPVET